MQRLTTDRTIVQIDGPLWRGLRNCSLRIDVLISTWRRTAEGRDAPRMMVLELRWTAMVNPIELTVGKQCLPGLTEFGRCLATTNEGISDGIANNDFGLYAWYGNTEEGPRYDFSTNNLLKTHPTITKMDEMSCQRDYLQQTCKQELLGRVWKTIICMSSHHAVGYYLWCSPPCRFYPQFQPITLCVS